MSDIKKIIIFGLTIILCTVSVAPALGLQFEKPRIEGFHPLDEEPYEASPLNAQKPVIFKLNTRIFKDTSKIDFEKRQITFHRGDPLGFTMWEYHFSELSDYLASRRNYVLFKGWYRDVLTTKRETDKKKQQQSLKMQWEMPVQYPSWAQRVLGNEPPRLKIDGNLTITMGFDRSTDKDAKGGEDSKESNNNFNFDISYQFGINGTIGKLINVSIRVVDDEFVQENNFKNFKIEYKESTPGEMEDEIIQEVIAGWTKFDMPGTELTGTYGGKDGLFGIKIKSKLGPLTLTTIASQEKGEATKSSFSRKKGGSVQPVAIDKYKLNKIFFLDTLYRSYYNKKYSLRNPVEGVQAPVIDTLEVFLRWNQIEKQGTVQATVDHADNQLYHFKKLKEGNHFEFDRNEGWIRFDTTINSSDHIALYMRSADAALNRGSRIDTLKYGNLWTIKPSEPIYRASDDPARFYLMWRNIYDLDTNNLSSFEIKVKRYTDDGADTTERTPDNRLITEVLGLTDVNGKALISDTKIYDRNNGLIIIPPYDTCSTCNEPFNNQDLGGAEYCDPIIYTFQPADQQSNYKPAYSIVTTGSRQESTIALNWQVMHGSELVKTFSGEVLERDRDYIIDYESGTLELISPRALAADGIDVTYQNEALFVPESKVFLGARGEIALPFLSDKSFISGLILFQNASSNNIPRLGQEPYSKVLFDVNVKIDLEPEWMTELVDRLPLVQTNVASSVVFEFEAAHSRTNPNTNENAYIDDFEDSKRTYPLGIQHESWYKASPPFLHLAKNGTGFVDSLFIYDSIYSFPPAWDFYWFYPRTEDKAYRDSVWVRTATKANLNDDDYDPILRLHCTPAPNNADVSPLYKNAWAGIMTTVSRSSFGNSEYKYFEFAANLKGKSGKKLIIQMGVMNEDISINGGPPNREGDREDTTLSGTGNLSMDLGLDRKDDKDEFYLISKADSAGHWDTLWYGNPLLGDDMFDPAKDNAKRNNKTYEKDIANRRHACRLQGDGRLTSEDIDYDGIVQYGIKERYYEFTIDLDDSIFFDKTARVHTENGWRKYRIPLLDQLSIKDSVNNPAWNSISMVRLIWTGFDSTTLTNEQILLISDLQFTGNSWLADADSNKSVIVEATSLSNQEDLAYANNSTDPRINRKKIPGTNDYELEQALKISFSNVHYQVPALVTRSFRYQKMDISQYRRMTLLYFGDTLWGNMPDAEGVLYNGDLHFVFRFGSNDSTYYEYHDKIRTGWQQAIIDLQSLTKLKNSFVVQNPGAPIDASSGNYRVVAKKIGTEPSIANISWMALGVEVPTDNGLETYKGAIWVNEMMVDGISQMNGWAARTSLKTKFADLLNFDVYANYYDSDFKMMNESGYLAGSSRLQTGVSGNINADRFFPRDWGVSIPVGGTISSDVDRPQLKSNSDMRLENDGIMAMVSDAFETITGTTHADISSSESEQYGTKRFSGKVYTNYSKSAKSDNPLVNLTADRITTSVSHTRSITLDNLGPSPDGSMIYTKEVAAKDYTGRLSYNLSPENPPEWTMWKPFGNVKDEWANSFKQYELALLPTTIKFDLADVNYGRTATVENKTGVYSDVYRYDLKHGFTFSYKPIDPLLQIDYDVSINRDLDSMGRYGSNEDKLRAVIDLNDEWDRYNILHGEINRNQRLQLSLKPEILSWLTTNFDYSSAYSSVMVTQRNDSHLYMNATVRPRFSFSSSWQIGTMLNKLAELTKKNPSGALFAKIDTGYGKIGLRSISFSYSAETSLKNDYLGVEYLGRISFWDFFRYQTGFYGRDKLMDYIRGSMDENALGGMRSRQNTDSRERYLYDSKSITRRYSVSTGLDLKFPFEISFSPISLEWSNSVNLISRDTTNYDSVITLPKIQVSASTSALMKLDFIKNNFKSFRCNSTYNFEKTESKSMPLNYKESRKTALRPLLSVYGNFLAAPVSVNYSYNRSSTNDKSGDEPKSITTTTSDKANEHDLSVNYEIQKNSRLSEVKFLKWTIPVSGKTTVGLKGMLKTQLSVKEYPTAKNDDGSVGVSDTTRNLLSYSLSPKVTYVFTNNIDGEAFWEIGQDRDRNTGAEKKVRTSNKFAIILKVKL